MSSFDGPNREQAVPPAVGQYLMQALQLMNDVQQWKPLVIWPGILKEGGVDANTRVRWAWRVVTARYPEAAETQIITNVLAGHRARFAKDAEGATHRLWRKQTDPNSRRGSRGVDAGG